MIIGITGNSGSGKSCVAELMAAEYDAYIIDADKIAHDVLKYRPAYDEIIKEFGKSMLDAEGNINRLLLGKIVFADEKKRLKLIEITHKYIIEKMLAQLEAVKTYPYVIMDAPLLIEAGLHKFSDAVWLVYAPPEVRLARIMARDGLTEEDAWARINNQTGFDDLKPYADVVINNDEGTENLRAKVRQAIEAIPAKQKEYNFRVC